MPLRRPRHWLGWFIGAIVVLAVAGPFVYIHFFNGSTPSALSLSPTGSPASPSGTTATAGTAAAFSVPMDTVHSDKSQRDA